MRTRLSWHWPLLGLALLLFQTPQAFAFNDYSGCVGCHGDFTAGTYTSPADGSTWTDGLHDTHRNAMLGGVGSGNDRCNVCHSGSGFSPVLLGSSNGIGAFPGISCTGCHGRAEPAPVGRTRSSGLRQHHWNNGVTSCAGCHSDDSNPSVFTTAAESVVPPYYSLFAAVPNDPCTAENVAGGAKGLDNDGDDFYDASDPDPDSDCVAAVPNIAVDPASLDFSTVTVGSSSSLTTRVSNTGTADLNISGIALGAGTSTEFTWDALTNTTIPAGGSETLTVNYGPIDIGDDSGSIVISSDDPGTPTVPVSLAGTGVAPPAPDINLVPGGVDFGTVTIGSTGTQTAQIQNVGDVALVIDSISLCAGTSTEFTWDALGNTTIPAGGSETLTVNYSPTDAGTDSGCLSIASNDPDENPIEFTVAGSGTVAAIPDIALDPTALDFGPVTVGGTSTLTSLIRNQGSAELEVTGVALSATTSGDFELTPFSTPVTIGPGGTATIEVTYSPSDVDLDDGAVEITSNDPNEPTVELALSGAGVAVTPLPPDINLNPAALDFGDVTIGNTESLITAVENLGGEPLSVTMIDRCSSTSTEFSWTPSAPFTVPAADLNGAGQVELTVSYTPTDVGLDEGCLAIASNDPNEASVELALSGRGQQPRGEMEVMIKVPGAINPENEGVTPVKLYAEGRDVRVERVRCGRDDEDPERINFEDFNDDGFIDTVALFETDDLEIECGDTTFDCYGMLEDGTDFTGTSSEFRTAGRECRGHDEDEDGVSDEDEYEEGTDPHDPDTDDDGLDDGEEREDGTDPRDEDTDDDGLDDGDERDRGTDPSDSDTDDDGMTDGDEVNVFGTNPLVADSAALPGGSGSSGGGCTLTSRSTIDPTLPAILAMLGLVHVLRRRVSVKR